MLRNRSLFKKNQVLYFISFTILLACSIPGFSQSFALDSPEFTAPEPSARYTTGDLPVSFHWTVVAGADEYEVEFAIDSLFTAPFSLNSEVNELDLANLIDQATWNTLSIQLFLHVRGLKNSEPLSGWSETLEFAKTIAGATQVVSPVDDTRFLTGRPLPIFKWAALSEITDYIIEFAADEDFEFSMGAFNFPGTEIDCNVSGDPEIWNLLTGTFYWRVCGMENSITPTPWTPTLRFSKTTESPPAPISPPDLTIFSGASLMPTFTWEPLPHLPSEYHIQFAYGSAFFPAGGSYIPVPNNSYSFAAAGITQEMWDQFYGELKWRVAGLDVYGNHGAFSTSYSFVKLSAWNYMAFGDSITGGFGASNWGSNYAGYPPLLQTMLRQRISPKINLLCELDKSWFSGGHAFTGDEKINKAMAYHGPEKVLIMFGIIDVVDPGATGCEDYDCQTVEHLEGIINKVRSFNATPYISLVTPVNPDSDKSFLQEEIDELNFEIRSMAAARDVPLCDIEQAFNDAPLPLESYFAYDSEEDEPDWAHFNDSGYQIIAEAWNELL